MFTGIAPQYIRHVYKVSRELKTYTVFELAEVKGQQLLTNLLRVEQYRNKSNATGIENYLRLRTASSWDKSEQVTGLRPTQTPGLFYGNRLKQPQPKTLLMFKYSIDRQTLFIDVYRGFYPNHNGILQNIISTY